MNSDYAYTFGYIFKTINTVLYIPVRFYGTMLDNREK